MYRALGAAEATAALVGKNDNSFTPAPPDRRRSIALSQSPKSQGVVVKLIVRKEQKMNNLKRNR
jgi:hypothetical protein